MTLQQCFIAAGSQLRPDGTLVPFVVYFSDLRDEGDYTIVAKGADEYGSWRTKEGELFFGLTDNWILLEKETAEARGETSQADCACNVCYGTVPAYKEAPVSRTNDSVSKREFKVGDRVRILTVDGNGCDEKFIGKLGTVIRDASGGLYPYVRPDGDIENYCFRLSQVELVDERSNLEELVRRANLGLEALEVLGKQHKDKVQTLFPKETDYCNPPRDKFQPISILLNPYKPRVAVKPTPPKAPTFEPITLPDSRFAVGASENPYKIKVGCAVFEREELFEALHDILKLDRPSTFRGSLHLESTRTGIRTSQGEVTWRDADILLEALERYKKALDEHERLEKEAA